MILSTQNQSGSMGNPQIQADLENSKDIMLMKKIRQQYSKRSFAEIRDLISQRLALRPSTKYELQTALKLSLYTIQNHLNWLKEVGTVYEKEFSYKGRKVKVWFAATNPK